MEKGVTKIINIKTEPNNNINWDIFNKCARINLISNTLITSSKYSRNTFSNLVLKNK